MLDRRVVYTGPGELAFEQFEEDQGALTGGEVLIRTIITLISPGTELAKLHGFPAPGTTQPRAYPSTNTGYSHVGVVVAAGPAASVTVGQRVFSMSHHTTLARVDTTRQVCLPIPDGLPDDQAVFTRLAVVSTTAAQRTIARMGDPVAVLGLGPIGNLAAQVMRLCGYSVNAFELLPRRQAMATQCGIRSVFDGFDIGPFMHRHLAVIEATGSTSVLERCLDLVCNRGEILMVGAPWGGARPSQTGDLPLHLLTGTLFRRFVSLRSGWESELPLMGEDLAVHSVIRNCRTVMGWLQEGRLITDPLVTHRINPDDILDAYRGLKSHPDEFVGVLIDWQ